MMGRFACALFAALMISWATTATAKPYIFRANAVVSSASSADRSFQQVPNPPSTIRIGDTFSVQFTLDPVGAIPSEFFAADPAINIYYYYVTGLVMRAGSSFVTRPALGERTFASFQLWNDRVVTGINNPVDSFTFSLLRNLPDGGSAVDLGSGTINTQFHYNAFDFTATARRSDSLNELPGLQSYGSRSGFFGFFNSDSFLQTNYQLNFTSASLTAVPESSTWLLMIVGFGVIGGFARTRISRSAGQRGQAGIEATVR